MFHEICCLFWSAQDVFCVQNQNEAIGLSLDNLSHFKYKFHDMLFNCDFVNFEVCLKEHYKIKSSLFLSREEITGYQISFDLVVWHFNNVFFSIQQKQVVPNSIFPERKKVWKTKNLVCSLNFCCFVLYLYKLLISLSPRHIFLSRFNVKWGHYSYIPLSLVSTIGANYFWTCIWDFTPLQYHEMFSNFHTLGLHPF